MSQYVYSMHRVGKIVPPNRQILKDISLSFLYARKGMPLGPGEEFGRWIQIESK